MVFRNKKASIAKVTKVCKAVANGDFEARILNINETGDVGEMMHSINLMIDRIDAYIRESKACMDYVSRNQHFRLISEKGMLGSFQNAAASVNLATDKIRQRHEEFCDLGTHFEGDLEDLIGGMVRMITNLKDTSHKVANASHSAQEQSLLVASGAEEASSNMQSVSSSVEQLTKSISEINGQVENSSEIARKSVEKSRGMNEQIESLAKASQQISDVVSLISEIAAQTNLLALNATIEAARAGEAGRGFAIVAQEVKTLSAQTAKATENISEQINGLQAATERAVQANLEISSTIEQVSEISQDIFAAVHHQSIATQEIAQNMEEAAMGTADVSKGVTKVKEATTVTEDMAEELQLVSQQMVQQEGNLDKLRKDLTGFLVNVRKVG